MVEEFRSDKSKRIEIERWLRNIFPAEDYDICFRVWEHTSIERYIVSRVIRRRSGFLGLKTTKSLERVLDITPEPQVGDDKIMIEDFVHGNYLNIDVKVLTESEIERARKFAQNFESLTNAKARIVKDY